MNRRLLLAITVFALVFSTAETSHDKAGARAENVAVTQGHPAGRVDIQVEEVDG